MYNILFFYFLYKKKSQNGENGVPIDHPKPAVLKYQQNSHHPRKKTVNDNEVIKDLNP